jgi:AcrR family transcriptional regulator
MSRKRDEAAHEAKRDEILDAAEALFVTHGFHQTGMAALCASVGMSPGALYRYFPSKTEIIRAIVERERAAVVLSFEPLVEAIDFAAALEKHVLQAIAAAAEERYASLTLEVAAEARRDPVVAEVVQRAEDEIVERLAGILGAAKRRGAVGSTVDPEVAARLLLAVVDGSVAARPTLALLPSRRLKPTLRGLIRGLLGLPHSTAERSERSG